MFSQNNCASFDGRYLCCRNKAVRCYLRQQARHTPNNKRAIIKP